MANEKQEQRTVNGLVLYLCEREYLDGYDRYLDKSIRISPLGDEVVLKQREFSIDELSELAASGDQEGLKEGIFSKFGINDLRSFPGIPKGPYYWIDSEVYGAIREGSR